MTTPKGGYSWISLVLIGTTLPASLPAAIVQIGDVAPNVSTWTSNIPGTIGQTSAGSVTVDGGSLLASSTGYVGNGSGSMGTATVTGAGSKWTSGYDLYVGNSGNGTLVIQAGGQVSNAYHAYLGYNSGSTGTATVTDAGSKWTNGGELYVGDDGNGTLAIEAGGEVSNSYDCYLGYNSGSTGKVTVTGADSKWTISEYYFLHVGYYGDGTLAIEAGGQVSNDWGYLGNKSGSTGTATVTGAGSKWTSGLVLDVGGAGDGTLTIKAGGQVSNTDGYLGVSSGSTGTATVTGAGSKWTNSSELYVGDDGNGTLAIEAGGEVSSAYEVHVGYGSGSTGMVTVTDAGSKWTNSYSLEVGYFGNGTLAIEAGGEVSNTDAFVGGSSGSTGKATVTGTGSKWTNNGDLYVGWGGNGILTIETGGQVSNTSGYVGYFPSSSMGTGTVTVTGTGSKWTNNGYLSVGDFRSNGTLIIEEGGQVSNIDSSLGSGSGTTGTATVTGPGSKWTNNGSLYVGPNGSIATLVIDQGGLVGVKGSLTVGNSSDFINMTAGGMLALYGNAGNSLSQFLGLVAGNDAGLRFWSKSLSNWAPLTVATPGVDYTLNYLTTGDLAGYTLLTVLAAGPSGIPGDFNADGAVNAADYVAWRNGLGTIYTQADYNAWRTHFGQTTGASIPGDFNADGAVNAADYVAWRNGLGTTYTQADYNSWSAPTLDNRPAPASATAAVPEPATFLLLMFLVASCRLLRSRA